MTTKPDYPAVPRDMTAERHPPSGEPPTTDELIAYGEGKLRGADEERVRLWLAANPDAERALMMPLPDDPQPGDPDFLSDEEVSTHLAALRRKLRPEGRVLRFPVLTAIAAAMALVFAGLYWQQRNVVHELNELNTPHAISDVPLLRPSEHNRGPAMSEPAVVELGRRGGAVWLAVTPDADRMKWFQVTLYRGESQQPVWSSTAMQLRGDRLAVILPAPSLETDALYRIEVAPTPRGHSRVDRYFVRFTR